MLYSRSYLLLWQQSICECLFIKSIIRNIEKKNNNKEDSLCFGMLKYFMWIICQGLHKVVKVPHTFNYTVINTYTHTQMHTQIEIFQKTKKLIHMHTVSLNIKIVLRLKATNTKLLDKIKFILNMYTNVCLFVKTKSMLKYVWVCKCINKTKYKEKKVQRIMTKCLNI